MTGFSFTFRAIATLVCSLGVCAGCSGASDERYAEADQALAAAGTDLVGSGHCATVAQVPQDCPADITWRNHGQYVSCVAKNLSARVAAGDITEDQKSALVTVAAQSDVGHKDHAAEDADAGEPDFKSTITDECP